MDYDIRTTPHQLKAAAEWCQIVTLDDGTDCSADVEIAVDDRMFVVEQGDDMMAWDLGGEPATDVYLDAAPLDPTGSERTKPLRDALAELCDAVVTAYERQDMVYSRRVQDALAAAGTALGKRVS